MSEHLPTVKLTKEEWLSLYDVIEASIPAAALRSLLAPALSAVALQKLFNREDPEEAITKEMTAAIAQGLADLHPGGREADIAWALDCAFEAWGDTPRTREIIAYVRQRVEEWENRPDPKPDEPNADILRGATWYGKSKEMAADWPLVGKLTVLRCDSSRVVVAPVPPLDDGDLVLAYHVFRNGRWVGGGFEGMGQSSFSQKEKAWTAAKTGIPGKPDQAKRDECALRNNEVVLLSLLGCRRKVRTPAVAIKYPSGEVVDIATLSPLGPEPVPLPVPVSGFTPPERDGHVIFNGSGAFNTFADIGRTDANPRNRLFVECWFRLAGWSHTERTPGACLACKGLVGRRWAWGLTVRPDRIAYMTMRGDIEAPAKINLNQWHHVRAVATRDGVRFWLDGEPIPTNPTSFAAIGAPNDDPVRVGGYFCEWPHATWFNQSVVGKITGLKIETE